MRGEEWNREGFNGLIIDEGFDSGWITDVVDEEWVI